MSRILFLFFILFTSSWVMAGDICQATNQRYFNTKIQTGQFNNSQRCFIMISPINTSGLVYRTHIFTSIGEHMIFNSFGDGPISTHTGARVLRHLPYNLDIQYKLNQATIELSLPNSAIINFDAKSSTIANSVGLELQEQPSINRNNHGGIIVHSSDYLYLDFGFTLGASPTNDLRGSFDIHFTDRVCSAQNSDVLFRVASDVRWRFNSNQALIRKLTQLCP